MSSAWECGTHGAVSPLRVLPHANAETLLGMSGSADVPVWCPSPLPVGWCLTGLASVGDGRRSATASAVALSGPSPLGGPADLVLVAEEPGTGLGARYAGTDGLDPGEATMGAPEAKVEAAGHDTPLWRAPSAPDRVAFVGEASGVWLWAVLWPPQAELVLLEHMVLHDQRATPLPGVAMVFGAASHRLREPAVAALPRRD